VVRLSLAPLLLTATLAGCGGHGAATATHASMQSTATKPAAAQRIHVRLTAQSHHPRVGKPWSYEVRVSDSAGRPVAARVHLQIVFGGVPVGQVGRHRVANGVWRERIGTDGNAPFPARARGQPLVFEAVVTAKGQTVKADYPITVR
jgi:hypothetical protein